MHMFCIVLADCPNSLQMNPVNAEWKNPKTLPLPSCLDSESAYFAYQWHHRPTPWPLAFDLFAPATSHNNNNNNGRLHDCVHAAEDIKVTTRLVVECESQQQFDLIIGPHKRFWFPWTSHFHPLFVVYLVSPSTVCLYTVRKLYMHAPRATPDQTGALNRILFWGPPHYKMTVSQNAI